MNQALQINLWYDSEEKINNIIIIISTNELQYLACPIRLKREKVIPLKYPPQASLAQKVSPRGDTLWNSTVFMFGCTHMGIR